jgi:hypothetical protein
MSENSNAERTDVDGSAASPCSTEPSLGVTDNAQWVERCWDAFKRNMIRRCARCECCKRLLEFEFERTKEVQRKQIQCLCGYITPVTYFP